VAMSENGEQKDQPDGADERLLGVLGEIQKSAKEVLRSMTDAIRSGQRTEWIQIAIGIAALLLMVLSVAAGIVAATRAVETAGRGIRTEVSELSEGVDRVAEGLLLSQFRITSPVEGASVRQFETIRGRTPYPDLKHYLVVVSSKRGSQVQRGGPLVISSGGLWTGNAVFGQARVGIGEEFTVRCLAARSELSPRELPPEMVPEDAVFSDPIIVTRVE